MSPGVVRVLICSGLGAGLFEVYLWTTKIFAALTMVPSSEVRLLVGTIAILALCYAASSRFLKENGL